MKSITKALTILILACSFVACEQHESTQTKPTDSSTTQQNEPSSTSQEPSNTKIIEPRAKIGIILPNEHKALQDIVSGFTTKLQEVYSAPVEIKVLNAQGDVKKQQAMIKKLHDQHYSMIVPVTTDATLMTTSMIHDIPIISLAAKFSEKDRQELHPCNIAIVHDAIPAEKIIALIHDAYPNLKHLTLVHSGADNILREVRLTTFRAEDKDIILKSIKVTTPAELANVAKLLPAKTEGILILKDSLIISGISELAKIANDKHIPLITSDQGSAQVAAGFALGVRDQDIGREGATLAAAVLLGDAICTLENVEMKNTPFVFINKEALKQQAQDVTAITEAAKKLNYKVEFVDKS